MSLDIRKSAGKITAHALRVSQQGLVAARQRKINLARPPESSGRTLKTQVQSTEALPLRRHASGR